VTGPVPRLTVDPNWLTAQLGAGGHLDPGDAVATIALEALTFVGATSDMARARITYRATASRGPSSLIVKIRGRDEVRRQIDATLQLFARETHVYRDVAAQLPIRTPRAFAFGDGDATPLMLEDLGHMRTGDQTQELAVEDAERCVDALADLHAAFWDTASLSDPRLMRPHSPPYTAMTAQLMASGVARARAQFAGDFPAAVLEALPEHPDDWSALLSQLEDGPLTLIQNDCRADNLFFTSEGAPVFVDWQLAAAARGSQDLANLLAGSLAPKDLSVRSHELLMRYHARLRAGGVTTYSFDELLHHYRQSVLWPLGQGLALLGALSDGDSRGVGQRIVRRALGHAVELDTFAAFSDMSPAQKMPR